MDVVLKGAMWCCFGLFLLPRFVQSDNLTTSTDLEDCESSLDGSTNYSLCYCNSSLQDIRAFSNTNWRYLSTYLATLRAQNYTQFTQECQQQTYAFTEFTELVYLRFCNRSEMLRRCFDELRDFEQNHTIGVISETTWEELIQNIVILQIKSENLANACFQVALLDKAPKTQARFHEMAAAVPFCSMVWCGFDEDVFNARDVTFWTCIPAGCRANLIVVFVVCLILAVATTHGNATVIGVFSANKDLFCSQAIYRTCLAMSDLMVGIVIFPTFISTLYLILHSSPNFEIGANFSKFEREEECKNVSWKEIQVPEFPPSIPQPYYDVVGFFSSFSILVSINTLVGAAIDRFLAIYRPLKYHESVTISLARKLIVWILILAFVASILPVVVNEFRYALPYTLSIRSNSYVFELAYTNFYLICIVLMWIITVATFTVYRMHVNKRRKFFFSSQQSAETKKQIHLLATLGIMAGVFTLCVLPGYVFQRVQTSLKPSNNVITNVVTIGEKTVIRFASVEVVISLFLTSNSLWNYFIYSARDKTFRKATRKLYLKLFTCQICRNG